MARDGIADGQRGRVRRSAAALLALGSVVLGAGCAGRQGPRDLPPGARAMGAAAEPPARAVGLDSLGGFLGAGYLFNQDKHTASDLERTEHLVQERFGLGASGSIYSPSFLLYEATGVGGLSQDWAEDRSSGETFDTGTLYEADVSAHLFPKRLHPADLYFSRIEDFQPRVFLSKIETTTTTARGVQNLQLEGGNLRAEAGRRELEQSVFGAEEQEPFVEVTEDTFGTSGDYQISRHQSVAGSYTFQDVEQRAAENSFQAHNAIGDHTLSLGSEGEHQLRSRAEVRAQEGELDQDLLRIDQVFDSKITGSLDGDLGFHFERNDTNLLELEVLRGEGGLRHRLFESLTTSLTAQGGRLTADGQSTTDTVGGIASLNYKKRTPVGTLRMTYSSSLERRFVENDRGGAIDESHTFPDAPPEEIRLFQPRIDPASIVITDTSGLIFYREGIDYTVTQDASGFTTIARVFTGNIPQGPPGATVLVDYVFTLGTDFTLDTMHQNLRIEHELTGGLTPYFAFGHQDQHLSDVEGPGGLTPIRERSLLGGLEWRRESWLAGGEYETRESTVLPFDAVRLKAQASLRIAEVHQLIGNATQAWLFYEEPERDVAISQGTVRWRSTFERGFSFYLDGALRYEDDSVQGSSFGFSVGGGLEYRWRKLSIRLRAAHRETRGVAGDFRAEEVGLYIVREFGETPPSTSAAMERFLRQ
ncbi:MAG: hypothetical protein HY721_08835 [Planctomycetes bacterium]|nr:hypothetical protein [Planctomycetota bacterium]